MAVSSRLCGGALLVADVAAPLLEVRDFKSIGRARLRLHPVMVFVGPPAAGKSNLLEAVALYGYAVKVGVEAGAGVYESVGEVGYLDEYVRVNVCSDLASRVTLGEPSVTLHYESFRFTVRAGCPREDSVALDAVGEEGGRALFGFRVHARIRPRKTVSLPAGRDELLRLLVELLSGLGGERGGEPARVEYELVQPREAGGVVPVYSARLYGFDRMGVVENVALGRTGSRRPYYLDERGRNLGWLLYTDLKLLEHVGNIVRALSGLEVRPLSSGEIAFFDGARDVGAATVSDTVLRLLYGVAALLTARRFTAELRQPGRDGRVEFRPIVMLEEPEAHLYPLAFTELAELVRAASREAVVLITTHSGLLAELLWEKAGAEIVYTARDGRGFTRFYSVDVDKILNYVGDLDELVMSHKLRVEELREAGALVPVEA